MRDSNGDMLNVGVSITRDKAGSILSLLIKMSDNKGFEVNREWNTNSPEKLSQVLKILLQNKIPIVVEDTDFTHLKDLQIVKTLILPDEEKKLTEVNSTHSTALRVDTEQDLTLSNVSISGIIKNITDAIIAPPIQLTENIESAQQAGPVSNTFLLRTIAQNFATFTGFAGNACYDTTISYYTSDDGKQIAKADMTLDWVNFYNPSPAYLADMGTLAIFSNIRWSKAVNNAVPKVAELINSGKYNIIEVPGVNSSGLIKKDLITAANKIKLHPNQTLVIAHSAGTDAVAKVMPLVTRNKEEIFYLILSLRMASETLDSWMIKGGVSPDHVLTMDSLYDLPHWQNNYLLSSSNKFCHNNSDSITGSKYDVTLMYNVTRRTPFLGHGSMYEAIPSDDQFNIMVNKQFRIPDVNVSRLINDFIMHNFGGYTR